MPNLYVTEQGARIEREYDRIVVSKGREMLVDVPAIKVSQIVLVGRVGVTTPALHMLLERNIGLTLLSSTGRFLGRLAGDRNSNTALVRSQYERANDPMFRTVFARAVVRGKLTNCRVRCLRTASRSGNPVGREMAGKLQGIIDRLNDASTPSAVRALEAQGARTYFVCLRAHLRPAWVFPSRKRRPPPDPVNVLLSLCYTLLTEAVYSAVVLAGLDPYCGFYHTERWGRPALILDLMEEFRPLVADTVVLQLINKKMLSLGEFRPGPPDRPVILSRDGYKTVLRVFGQRLRGKVTVPGPGRRTTYQRLLEYQARQMAHFIDGTANSYEPFCTR